MRLSAEWKRRPQVQRSVSSTSHIPDTSSTQCSDVIQSTWILLRGEAATPQDGLVSRLELVVLFLTLLGKATVAAPEREERILGWKAPNAACLNPLPSLQLQGKVFFSIALMENTHLSATKGSQMYACAHTHTHSTE